MPGPVVGNPTSQQGADDRSEHDAHPKDRHGHPVLLARKGFQKDGLGNRLQGTAARALEDSEKNKALEAPCGPAHKGANGEQGDGKKEVTFPTKEPAQPSGHGDDDRVGNEVRSNDPG